MPRGGYRPGAGRKKGTTNSEPFLQSEVVPPEPGKKLTTAQRHHAMKRQVALCVNDGMSPEKIAAVMGIPLDKLKAVFGHELEHGREIVRSAELARLDAASADGKVNASKLILASPGAGEKPETPGGDGNAAHANVIQRALRLVNGGKNE